MDGESGIAHTGTRYSVYAVTHKNYTYSPVALQLHWCHLYIICAVQL